MTRRMPMTFAFTGGFILCAVLMMLVDFTSSNRWSPAAASHAAPLGAVPRHRDGLAVLNWVFAHHPDAENLHFIAWLPPLAVEDNPFTGSPATAVHVLVKNLANGPDAEEELLRFYLQDGEVLGSVPAKLRKEASPPRQEKN